MNDLKSVQQSHDAGNVYCDLHKYKNNTQEDSGKDTVHYYVVVLLSVTLHNLVVSILQILISNV